MNNSEYIITLVIVSFFLLLTDDDYDKCMSQGGGAVAALPPPMDSLLVDMSTYDSNILTVGKSLLIYLHRPLSCSHQ